MPDFDLALEKTETPSKEIRRLNYYFRAARRNDEALAYWRKLETRYPALSAPLINRAEMELALAKNRGLEASKVVLKERKKALGEAKSAAERSAVQAFFDKKLIALWAETLAPVEALLRSGLERFEEPDLQGLLGDVLEAQARVEEAESFLGKAARGSDKPIHWGEFIRFLIRRGNYETAWKAGLEAQKAFPKNADLEKLTRQAQDKMLSKGNK